MLIATGFVDSHSLTKKYALQDNYPDNYVPSNRCLTDEHRLERGINLESRRGRESKRIFPKLPPPRWKQTFALQGSAIFVLLTTIGQSLAQE